MEKTSEWLLSFSTSYVDHNLLKEMKREGLSFHSGLSKKARTISVTGGKGGVGKTSVALKLGRELASIGYRVLLLDCDYNLANTAIKLGLPLNDSFYSLLSAEKKFEECLHRDGRFHLLSGCNGSLELFENKLPLDQVIIDIINSHEYEYDFILLDCPAGLSKDTLNLNAYCDERFFIVTPDKSSITDSYSLMKVLANKYGIKDNHLIINMFSNEEQYSRVVRSICDTAEHFLHCRTNILGGIRKLDVKVDTFDFHFIHEKNAKLNEDFSKVVKRYAEKTENAEHEVQ